ncbi:MAG: YciI family protein [Acidimicrobiales bacterium]
MQFVVIAHDHEDDDALARRLKVRPEHMARCEKAVEQGTLVYAVALLDDSERMIGSVMVLDLPNREDVDRWLDDEPYKVNDVWCQITVTRGRIGPWFGQPLGSITPE